MNYTNRTFVSHQTRGVISVIGGVLTALSLVCSGSAFAGYCTDAPIDGHIYKLVNEGSGLTMEVTGLSKDDGVRIIQQPSRSSLLSQQYQIVDAGQGNWQIEPVHSQKALSVDAKKGVVQKSTDGKADQQWQIVRTSTGSYQIISDQSGQLLTVENYDKGAFVVGQSDHHTADQHWYFNPVVDSDDVENTSCQADGTAVRLDGGAGDGQVFLSWDDPTKSDNPIGNIESLKIYTNSTSDPNGRKLVTSIGTTLTSYVVTGLKNDKAQWFWVTYTIDGKHHNSNAFLATPKSSGALLSQHYNPDKTMLDNYKDWLTGTLAEDSVIADNILSWQLPSGGFYKNKSYDKPWDGTSARSKWLGEDGAELGTIDNKATVTELMFLADVYQRSGETKYRDGARKALDFLFEMQHDNGGWPQVYPKRVDPVYSNYITFNDDAMTRVMLLLSDIQKGNYPFNGDLFSTEQQKKLAKVISQGVDFIVKSQIVENGRTTVWCAQFSDDYEPKGARSYELASKSGRESFSIAAYLMSLPQTDKVKSAAESAINWYNDPNVKVVDTAYVKRPKDSTDDTYNPIQHSPGSVMWYRFYKLGEVGVPIFSGRLPTDNPPGVGPQDDLMKVEPERRYGYAWGSSKGTKLLDYARKVGYLDEE
jgi:PelA/Pel-15E family pectate lyase